MSSCCGMPPRSQEPEYPLHPALDALVRRWDQEHSGFLQEVYLDIGCGDWDAMKEGEANIPPYTLERAIEASKAHLAQILLAAEQKAKREKGSWHVRWGITKLPEELSPAGRDKVGQFYEEAQALLREPVAISGAEFQYQIRYSS